MTTLYHFFLAVLPWYALIASLCLQYMPTSVAMIVTYLAYLGLVMHLAFSDAQYPPSAPCVCKKEEKRRKKGGEESSGDIEKVSKADLLWAETMNIMEEREGEWEDEEWEREKERDERWEKEELPTFLSTLYF